MTSPYFTAADLAHLFHLSRGSIYRMASQDHWRRTRYRPIRYHMDDARTSYTRRHKVADTINGTAGSANSPAAP